MDPVLHVRRSEGTYNSYRKTRSSIVKAAAAIGEVLAVWLKMEELVLGLGGEIQMDVEKEFEKKVMDTRSEVWVVVNALRKRGVKGLDLQRRKKQFMYSLGNQTFVIDEEGNLLPPTP